MAVQAGFGLTRIILIAGAGYTGSILIRNGKLSDVLGELQEMLKEKTGEKSEEYGDAIATQVKRLAMEVRQLASARPIVVNGNSGNSGNVTALIVPAVALGALGYGYMWWKGLSFSDLMYVTKSSMTTAVSNMTKHLEQVTSALAATKRHLTQRIENVDGKLDEQKEMSKEIKSQVTDVRGKISNIGCELNSLQELVYGLDGKINAIEYKQKFTCDGVMYLCKFVQENGGGGAPDFLQGGAPMLTNKCRFTGSTDSVLKGIALAIESGSLNTENFDKINKVRKTNESLPNDLET